MHSSLNHYLRWSPPARALPQQRNKSLRSLMVRAVYPHIIEFKVISRESNNHEFMPIVYLIDRSPAWCHRVPSLVETALVKDYVAPLVAKISDASDVDMSRKLTTVHEISADETDYKTSVFVDFAAVPNNSSKAPLNRVVFQIATALRTTVAPLWCPIRRYASVRYGAPVILEEREIAIFIEDPTEFIQHFSARLRASLAITPPSTMLRLTRTLHVHCANIVRDDCFSQRQRASMNEEIFQIYFRTLERWKFRDEDINSPKVLLTAKNLSKHPLLFVKLLAAVLRYLLILPSRLFVSSICDLIYRFPPRQALNRSLTLVTAASEAALVCSACIVMAYWCFLWMLNSPHCFI
ncbi:hypothetical protein CCR75_009154 [Bremia lactucae]|uniref:Uncharacterized protein n=1 Tax=Bremia lactucae TaxID=4779 RepID=A0A976IDW2_BRELC|nr:hypothetical protein CCR75_009154 [Bremia lactucae]